MHTPEGGVEITQGLAAGELLVVRGFEPLSEGAPVQISDRTTLDAAPGATPAPPGATGGADDGAAAAAAPRRLRGSSHRVARRRPRARLTGGRTQ